MRARAQDRYIALSYVYEKTPAQTAASAHRPRDARRENVDMLTATIDDASMPQAIADAIWLARKLGIHHLWVDRFCIVQDDDLEREEYLRNMAYVFANAYLVVVAAAGEDADTGLSALVRPGGKAPPPVPKAALGPPGRKGHEDMLMDTRWRDRCWTMQEGFYGRRALFVFQDTMTWECHCDTWNMAGDGPIAAAAASPAVAKVPGLQRMLSLRSSSAPSGPARHLHRKCTARVYPAALAFRHTPWPDLDEYARICMDFSARRLGNIQDTPDAFRGFTTVLARTFAGGFVCGMPVLFLDAALLWRPAATIRRRQLVPTMSSGGMPPVPSWSWLGWFFDGAAADMTLWRAAADYVLEAGSGVTRNGKGAGGPGEREGEPKRRYRSANSFRLRTTTAFHITDRATTVQVRNDGMRFRNTRHHRKGGSGLPLGWSKSASTGGFRHTSDPAAVFRYPIPLASNVPASEMPIGGGEAVYPGTLLSFSTTRAMLEVEFAAPWPAKSAGADGIPLAIGNLLAPRSGRWVGTLRSHDSWLGAQGANYEGEEGGVEVIAVSEGSERQGPGSDVWGLGCDVEEIKASADQDGIVEFVNVLWVERVGGVCYRRGVGHVLRRAWEVFGRERLDILLG